VACKGRKKNAQRVLVRTREEKRPLERPTCRWEYNIKIDLKEKEWKGVN
jgi:hypothetical protein